MCLLTLINPLRCGQHPDFGLLDGKFAQEQGDWGGHFLLDYTGSFSALQSEFQRNPHPSLMGGTSTQAMHTLACSLIQPTLSEHQAHERPCAKC